MLLPSDQLLNYFGTLCIELKEGNASLLPSRMKLCCSVLPCAVLHCSVLFYTVLCCSVLKDDGPQRQFRAQPFNFVFIRAENLATFPIFPKFRHFTIVFRWFPSRARKVFTRVHFFQLCRLHFRLHDRVKPRRCFLQGCLQGPAKTRLFHNPVNPLKRRSNDSTA